MVSEELLKSREFVFGRANQSCPLEEEHFENGVTGTSVVINSGYQEPFTNFFAQRDILFCLLIGQIDDTKVIIVRSEDRMTRLAHPSGSVSAIAAWNTEPSFDLR